MQPAADHLHPVPESPAPCLRIARTLPTYRQHPVCRTSLLCPRNVCASRDAQISNHRRREEDLMMPKSIIVAVEWKTRRKWHQTHRGTLYLRIFLGDSVGAYRGFCGILAQCLRTLREVSMDTSRGVCGIFAMCLWILHRCLCFAAWEPSNYLYRSSAEKRKLLVTCTIAALQCTSVQLKPRTEQNTRHL